MLLRFTPLKLLSGLILALCGLLCPLMVIQPKAATLIFYALVLCLVGYFKLSSPKTSWVKLITETARSPLFTLLMVIYAYMILSCLWSYDRPASIAILSSTGPIFLLGTLLLGMVPILPYKTLARIKTAFLIGSILSLGLIVIECYFDGFIHDYIRDGQPQKHALRDRFSNSTLLIALILPQVFWQRNLSTTLLSSTLTLFSFLVLNHLEGSAALVGLFFGMSIALLYWLAPRRAILYLGTLMLGLGWLAHPLITHYILKPSTIMTTLPGLKDRGTWSRLYIWEHTHTKIMQKPLLGWGLGVGTPKSTYFRMDEIPRHYPETLEREPHISVGSFCPHNAILHIWLELGFLGAILGAAVSLFAFKNILTNGTKQWQARSLATYSAATLISVINFGIWQTWWLCALFLCAFLSAINYRIDD